MGILKGQINIFETPMKKTDMEIVNKLGESYWKFFKKYMFSFSMILDLEMKQLSKKGYEDTILICGKNSSYNIELLTQEKINLFWELSLNRIERILKIDVAKYR